MDSGIRARSSQDIRGPGRQRYPPGRRAPAPGGGRRAPVDTTGNTLEQSFALLLQTIRGAPGAHEKHSYRCLPSCGASSGPSSACCHPLPGHRPEENHAPAAGALVCAATTPALSDPLLTRSSPSEGGSTSCRPMAKAELHDHPGAGLAAGQGGRISPWTGASRTWAPSSTAIKYLKSGEKVLHVSPRAPGVKDGVDKYGHESEAKSGAAMLAVRTGVPVVPVYVPAREEELVPASRTVVIGDPIPTPRWRARRAPPRSTRPSPTT